MMSEFICAFSTGPDANQSEADPAQTALMYLQQYQVANQTSFGSCH